MRIAMVTMRDPDRDVRVRKFAQWAYDRGHDLEIFYGPFGNRTEGLALMRAETLHGAKAYWIQEEARQQLKAMIEHRKPDLVWCHELAGVAAFLRGSPSPIPTIVDMHEWEMDRAILNAPPQLLEARAKGYAETMPLIDGLVSVSGSLVRAYEEELREVHSNPVPCGLLPNAPDVWVENEIDLPGPSMSERHTIRRNLRERLGVPKNAILVAFSGATTGFRMWPEIVAAMSRLPPFYRLVHVGPLPSNEDVLLGAAIGVHFLGRWDYPYQEWRGSMLEILAGCDLGLSLVRDTHQNHRHLLPNKIFEYAFSGLPVVVDHTSVDQLAFLGTASGVVVPSVTGEALLDEIANAIQTAARLPVQVDPEMFERWRYSTNLDNFFESLGDVDAIRRAKAVKPTAEDLRDVRRGLESGRLSDNR